MYHTIGILMDEREGFALRIVVLGDFYLDKIHIEMSRSAMNDVKESRPDLVVPLGDFGTSDFP